jgi:hypothetical protein
MNLLGRVEAVVAEFAAAYAGTAGAHDVADIAARLREPLRVAIAGKVKAGKSTLLNALVGELIAPTDASECTQIVTWYREGLRYRAVADMCDGTSAELRVRREANGVECDLSGRRVDDVARIVVEWPTSALRTMTLIDTPGVGSLSVDAGDRVVAFLAPEAEEGSPVDAVIYLTRHVHRADVRFLDAFHDDAGGRASPVNAIGVLSRADEIGGGRADSLASAARIAARTREEPTLRRLCQTVVPVAGLLAQGAATLTEAEHRGFGLLAAMADDDADALMLSADRFVSGGAHVALAPVERVHLLDRFGLFGVRLACALLRHGQAASARTLAAELRRRSGLDDLRQLLATRFTARRDVLKARSALLALTDVLRRYPLPADDVAALGAALERVHAAAHELAELRVLIAVRAGGVPLDADATQELERLLGSGASRHERLGLDRDDPADVRDAILEGVSRWRARAEHPLAPPSVVEASQIATRSLEGMLTAQPE